MPTLIPTQRLTRLRASHALRDDLEELRHKKKVLSDHLKLWADEALKISQDMDVVVKQLNWTLESVTATTEGLTSQNLVEIGTNTAT